MPQSGPAIAYNGEGSAFGGDFYANYKQVVTPDVLKAWFVKKNIFLNDCTTKDKFEGRNLAHTILYEDPQGGSVDFQTSIQNENQSSQALEMVIWRGRQYNALKLFNEEIAASRGKSGAFLEKKVHESQRIVTVMGNRTDIDLHGSGSGVIGSFTTGAAGTLSSNQIKLDVPTQVIRFNKGLWIQASSNNPVDGTIPTLLNPDANGKGARARIVGVKRSASQGVDSILTLNVSISTWLGAGAAANTTYFLLREGDGKGFGVNVVNGGVSGLKAWFPSPGAVGSTGFVRISPTDNFWSANRSVDETRLAGCTYVAQPGEKYQITLMNAGKELYFNGGGGDISDMVVYCSPDDYNGYMQEMGPQVRYTDDSMGWTGFKRAICHTQAGDVALTPDPQVDPGLFYMLDRSTYYIATLGEMPHLDNSDGLSAIRTQDGTDALEMRWRSWHQFVVDEPGKNLVGRFA